MLRNAAQLIFVLMLLIQVAPALASSEMSTKKFIACEKASLNHEKTSIKIDKEQKQDTPNLERISSLEHNIARIEKIQDRYCSDFPTQASNF